MAAQTPIPDYPFTEAPASVELRFTLRGYDCSLVLKDVTGQSVLTRLDAAITHLEKIGSAPNATPAPATNGTAANGTPPMCPIHNSPMKLSRHGGWYCPAKILDDDGSGKPVYCKAKA